jgi:hypothetical protein
LDLSSNSHHIIFRSVFILPKLATLQLFPKLEIDCAMARRAQLSGDYGQVIVLSRDDGLVRSKAGSHRLAQMSLAPAGGALLAFHDLLFRHVRPQDG